MRKGEKENITENKQLKEETKSKKCFPLKSKKEKKIGFDSKVRERIFNGREI